MKKSLMFIVFVLFFCFLQTMAAECGQLGRFEDKMTKMTLGNGLTFLIIERHEAPVASFVTMVKAGGVDEPSGKTGVAHLLEHMAFKGTKSIGTKDWEKEKKILKKLDQAYHRMKDLRRSLESNSTEVNNAEARFKELQKQAKRLTKPNEFSRIIERNGGAHLNAGTSADYTMYFCSLPANKAELWFSLESDRLKNPVWREFYTEKEVVIEERRMRIESDPSGRLMERLLALSYIANPYRNPVIGWLSDIEALSKEDLTEFYNRYYVPENMVMVVAGDVNPDQIQKWARTYFGGLKDKPLVRNRITKEPQQKGPRKFRLKEENPPVYVRAYHTVKATDPDSPDLDLLSDILSKGKTSRLYSQLVVEKELASKLFSFNGYPGQRFSSLFITYILPQRDVPLDKLISGLDKELNKIKLQGISQTELKRAKTKAKADLIRGLDSNLGLAKSMAKAEALEGDWRKVFTYLDELDKLTVKDIQRVAQEYFKKSNLTEGRIIPTENN